MKLVKQFETNKVEVKIIKSDMVYLNEPMFIIISTDKTTLHKYVRYGNEIQAGAIEKTYYNKKYIKE